MISEVIDITVPVDGAGCSVKDVLLHILQLDGIKEWTAAKQPKPRKQ